MAHVLPDQTSRLREAFEISDLVAMATGERPFPTLREAVAGAKRTLKASNGVRVFSIIMEADDRVSLVSVGPRGGWKREWTFGYGKTGNAAR